MKTPPKPFLVLGALLFIQFCFGSNYVISKLVVGEFHPLVWASIRILISTVVMFLVCFLSGRTRPPIKREYILPLVGLACLGTIFNQVCFLLGLRLTTSVNSAVINTLIPVMTLILVTMRGQEKLTWVKGLGFFLAFAGVLVIRPIEQVSFSNATFLGDLLTATSCFLYACFLSYGKPWMAKMDSLWLTAYLFFIGSIGISLMALPYWAEMSWPEMTTSLWGATGFAILFGTLTPYFLSFWVLKHAEPSKVALYIYVQPVITSLIAWRWFDESVNFRKGLAASFIFSGMLIAFSRYAQPKRSRKMEKEIQP